LAEQRERLLAATALCVARDALPSVASIVRHAGVGRNTFYEYFDDVQHAVDAAKVAVLRRIEQVMRDAESAARTPVERWRSLARAWLSFAEDESGAMLLVLTIDARSSAGVSSGATVLEAALGRSLETLRSAGVTSPPAGPERLLAVAAVGEAFARAVARANIAGSDAQSPPPSTTSEALARAELERSLVEVTVRLLR
jgi:AcrR family transcriptional regulator